MHTVLHVALEYTYGIGGLKAVMSGLLPALQENGVNTCVVTPFYDFIQHPDLELEQLATVTHAYKKTLHTSLIFRVNNSQVHSTSTINHYLIRPNIDSPVEQIFSVGNEQNIYKAFSHSEPQNRLEYFNGAISSLVRISQPNIPTFDIVHTHTWHTALSVCLIKEFEQLNWVKISNPPLKLCAIPKVISTVHMLSNEQGLLVGKKEIVETVTSVGLPLDSKFLIDHQNLNQMYIGLQYADQTMMVSKSFANDATTGKDYGLGRIFKTLEHIQRLNAINNGITIKQFDPTLRENLGEYLFSMNKGSSIQAEKQKIKQFLASQYQQLNDSPDTLWYLYVGRFATEKGIDMLPHALDAISECNGNLIVMGCYVATNDAVICNIISTLKSKKNVVVIDNKQEQLLVGKYFRAACEFTIIPSHLEACGLIAMEAIVNCSIPITSDIQGLPDTVISLIDNEEQGTGFMYHEDIIGGPENLKQIITIAHAKYDNWQKHQKLNSLLYRLYKESMNFAWKATPVKSYLKLYEKTMRTTLSLTPHIVREFPVIKVLHVALEYKEATLGGLGMVTTQLVDAENRFQNGARFESTIITPYYSMFITNPSPAIYISSVVHTYNNEQVESFIYLTENDHNKHFLIKPSLKHHNLFNLDNPCQIYSSDDFFIERVKYFNSAVAAFIATKVEQENAIIQLHGWTTSISAMMLREIHQLNSIKIVYTVHINNKDRGRYSNQELAGIGLRLSNRTYILKQIGIDYSDYIVGVSPSILIECSRNGDCLLESSEVQQLSRSFLQAKYTKTSIGILNGIDYKKYCKINKLMHNPSDIVASKKKIKQQLANQLPGRYSVWKINPDLPVILYIGRFSQEKGVECFKNLIAAIDQKAIFFALGKGFNQEVLDLIMQDSRQKDNIFITFSALEQEQYGDMIRAAADFTFIPSHEEACGLVAMEGFANGSISITSGVGGLKDFITPFKYNDGYSSGNGFFYKDKDESSLLETINRALELWETIPAHEKNMIFNRIITEGQQFDWLAENGAVQKYFELFKHILAFQEPKVCCRLTM